VRSPELSLQTLRLEATRYLLQATRNQRTSQSRRKTDFVAITLQSKSAASCAELSTKSCKVQTRCATRICLRASAVLDTMSAPKRPAAGLAKSTNNIRVGDQEYPLLDIRSTGDLVLDVSFKNTAECTKSIPKDALRELRSKKWPVPSPRIFYRVRLDTLKKHSEYFRTLLAPQFAEGVSVAETLSSLSKSNLNPAEIEAEKLPRVKIVDEDTATKTLGRELIFRDLLQVLHGAVS
jgi:hypothetical protein